MEENVRNILKRRVKQDTTALLILGLFIGYFIIWRSPGDGSLGLALLLLLLVGPVMLMYLVVDTVNYPQPKSYYRKFNKIFYLYASKYIVITSLIYAIYKLLRMAANPLFIRKEDVMDTIIAGGTAAMSHTQIKPAEYIEQYFQLQSMAKVPQENEIPKQI